jgi:hypothetical protein
VDKKTDILGKGYIWNGYYFFGVRKPLSGPAYILITTQDEIPVYVAAINTARYAKEILPTWITSRYKQYRVYYRDINQDDDIDVDNNLDYFRELYELEHL